MSMLPRSLSITGSIDEADDYLLEALHALNAAAMTDARRALRASSDLLDIAVASGRCAEAYRLIMDADGCVKSAERHLQAAAGIASMLCALHESLDDIADMEYSDYVMGMVDTDVISAILEGSARRFNEAMGLLPDPPAPAARFNGVENERHDTNRRPDAESA
jgi:hypothetical protein